MPAARRTRSREAIEVPRLRSGPGWSGRLAYGLALLAVVIAGMTAIRIIHGKMPEFDPGKGEVAEAGADGTAPSAPPAPAASLPGMPWTGPGGPAANEPPAQPPESIALMRTQGWVRPYAVEIYDETDKDSWKPQDGLPAEIAIVPAIQSDVMPLSVGDQGAIAPGQDGSTPRQDLAALPGATMPLGLPGPGGFPPPPQGAYELPPPLALPGWGAGRRGDPTALSRSEVATVEAGEGGDRLGTMIDQLQQPGAGTTDTGATGVGTGSPALANLDGGAAPSSTGAQSGTGAEVAPGGSDSGMTLAQATEKACANAGFFGRSNCEQRVKERFCEDRWGQTQDCRRRETVVNF